MAEATADGAVIPSAETTITAARAIRAFIGLGPSSPLSRHRASMGRESRPVPRTAASRPKRLFAQPGGFEGFSLVLIALKSAHLALVKVRHPSERNPGVQAAAPAASMYLPEGD